MLKAKKCAIFIEKDGKKKHCRREGLEFIKSGRKKIWLCKVHHTLQSRGLLPESRKIEGLNEE